jgi:hypothetical protein
VLCRLDPILGGACALCEHVRGGGRFRFACPVVLGPQFVAAGALGMHLVPEVVHVGPVALDADLAV